MKGKEKQKAKNVKTEKANTNKNLFSSNYAEPTTSTQTTEDNNESRDLVKKPKQRKVNKKHQNKYDIGNAVIDGSYDPFWKVLSKFLIDKAPLLFIIIVFIIIKKNPEIIRGTVFERILKKLYETIMLIININ